MCTRARTHTHTHTHTHTAGGRWPEGAESKGARGAQEAVAFTLAPHLVVYIFSLSFGLVAVCHRFDCWWSTICSGCNAKSPLREKVGFIENTAMRQRWGG